MVQEVFLDAMSGLRSIQNPAAVRGWLKTIAVRKASRHLRKRRLRAFLGLERDCCYEHLADPSCGPEERALLSRVYRQLDTLPVGDRVAWTLRHVDGEPLDSVAALCGCSLATVKGGFQRHKRCSRTGDSVMADLFSRIQAAAGHISAGLEPAARASEVLGQMRKTHKRRQVRKVVGGSLLCCSSAPERVVSRRQHLPTQIGEPRDCAAVGWAGSTGRWLTGAGSR